MAGHYSPEKMDYKNREALKSYHKEFHHIISAAPIQNNLVIAENYSEVFCIPPPQNYLSDHSIGSASARFSAISVLEIR